MKRLVDITIKTESIPIYAADDNGTETTKTKHQGELWSIEGGFMLNYKSDKTDNTLGVFGNLVTVSRTGNISSQLVFEEGRNYFGTFSDGEHQLQMITMTRRVESNLTEQGGSVLLDYSISFGGSIYERNKIIYTITPEGVNAAS